MEMEEILSSIDKKATEREAEIRAQLDAEENELTQKVQELEAQKKQIEKKAKSEKRRIQNAYKTIIGTRQAIKEGSNIEELTRLSRERERTLNGIDRSANTKKSEIERQIEEHNAALEQRRTESTEQIERERQGFEQDREAIRNAYSDIESANNEINSAREESAKLQKGIDSLKKTQKELEEEIRKVQGRYALGSNGKFTKTNEQIEYENDLSKVKSELTQKESELTKLQGQIESAQIRIESATRIIEEIMEKYPEPEKEPEQPEEQPAPEAEPKQQPEEQPAPEAEPKQQPEEQPAPEVEPEQQPEEQPAPEAKMDKEEIAKKAFETLTEKERKEVASFCRIGFESSVRAVMMFEHAEVWENLCQGWNLEEIVDELEDKVGKMCMNVYPEAEYTADDMNELMSQTIRFKTTIALTEMADWKIRWLEIGLEERIRREFEEFTEQDKKDIAGGNYHAINAVLAKSELPEDVKAYIEQVLKNMSEKAFPAEAKLKKEKDIDDLSRKIFDVLTEEEKGKVANNKALLMKILFENHLEVYKKELKETTFSEILQIEEKVQNMCKEEQTKAASGQKTAPEMEAAPEVVPGTGSDKKDRKPAETGTKPKPAPAFEPAPEVVPGTGKPKKAPEVKTATEPNVIMEELSKKIFGMLTENEKEEIERQKTLLLIILLQNHREEYERINPNKLTAKQIQELETTVQEMCQNQKSKPQDIVEPITTSTAEEIVSTTTATATARKGTIGISVEIDAGGVELKVNGRGPRHAKELFRIEDEEKIQKTLGSSSKEFLDAYKKAESKGDKWVAREIVRAVVDGRLTQQQAKEQMERYINLLDGNDEQKKDSRDYFTISYNFRRMRRANSEFKPSEVDEMEEIARKSMKAGIATVSPAAIKGKWILMDRIERIEEVMGQNNNSKNNRRR